MKPAEDLVSILILYTCFAARSLIAHRNNVLAALKKKKILILPDERLG